MSEENPMERVQALTEDYARERDDLAALVQEVQDEIDRITRRATPQIKARVRRVAEAHDRLRAEVEAHPELWRGKRRTVVVCGVRVGMAKGKGKIAWEDAGQVVRLIRRHFPEQADTLIRTREEPVRKALANLTVGELRKIGCDVEDTDDQVVIRPTDGQVDKLIQKLLEDAERVEQQEVA